MLYIIIFAAERNKITNYTHNSVTLLMCMKMYVTCVCKTQRASLGILNIIQCNVEYILEYTRITAVYSFITHAKRRAHGTHEPNVERERARG